MTNCCEGPQFNKGETEAMRRVEGKDGVFRFADELWFREEEKELIAERRLTTTIRAGDRTTETADPKGGYKEGRFVTLKIQKDDGEFLPLDTVAVVYSVKKRKLGEIEPRDLEGTPLKTKIKAELVEKLKRFYGKEFTDDDTVTIVRFEYKNNLREASDLVRTKILSLAAEPKDNPENLDFASYTIPLIEHDYPAKTPAMWNAAYREFQIEAGNIMLVGRPEESRQILGVLRQDTKYKGGGAGVGFKDEVISYLDELDLVAKEIGAVNFILKTSEGRLKGFNTDGIGYAQSLEERFRNRHEELAGKKAVILGAGGAGNAVAFALAGKGMRVIILNRTIAKARDLADKINRYFKKVGADEMVRFGGEELISAEVRDADAVINVSTKGSAGELEKYSALAPARLPANEENIRENLKQAEAVLRVTPRTAMVSDIVLGRQLTPLLEQALKAGFEILDGIPMVINQGVEAFWLLYGQELKNRGVAKDDVARVMKGAAVS